MNQSIYSNDSSIDPEDWLNNKTFSKIRTPDDLSNAQQKHDSISSLNSSANIFNPVNLMKKDSIDLQV